MSLKLWLMRHGQTSVNAKTWSDKPNEARLTALGQEQAQAAALHIKEAPQRIIISPLIRAQESAAFVLAPWPNSPSCIWPIQEFVYLSPQELANLSPSERTERIAAYWKKNDPFYCHGEGAESFALFLKRVKHFYEALSQLEGFVVAIGHGQFFKAFELGLAQGFDASPAWMAMYRENETKSPMKNGEILKLELNF